MTGKQPWPARAPENKLRQERPRAILRHVDDLATARLALHPLNVAEAERVALRTPSDEDCWAPGYPGPGDSAGARLYLDNCAASGDPWPFGSFEIRRREDGRAVGSVGFHGAPDEAGCVSIGYGLVPEARGQGFATEALRALLEFARELGITCVKGDADLDNLASQRVMAAAGMRQVMEDEQLRHYQIDWPETEPREAPSADLTSRAGAGRSRPRPPAADASTA